jgi:hypothetical protein
MNWKIKDMIKNGIITYDIGDEVVLLKRKKSGYPKSIKDDEVYIITNIENDNISIAQHSSDGVGWINHAKVNKIYLINKSKLRDIKINSILNETNRL